MRKEITKLAYSRVNWQDDRTPLSAYNLNRMDEEIYNMSSSLNKILVGGKISGTSIASNSLPGTVIIDNSITNYKISDGAVSERTIENGAITVNKISNGAVTTDKILNGAITSEKILDGSITGVDIAQGTILGANIKNKTITYSNLSSEGVTSGKTLLSDGSGGVSWETIPTASNTVQRITYNGVTYSAVEGTATFNQTQSDFNETDTNSPAYIKNKPSAMVLPSPTEEDENKIIFVNGNGNYTLGCPNEFRMGNWLIASTATNGFIIKWIGGNN